MDVAWSVAVIPGALPASRLECLAVRRRLECINLPIRLRRALVLAGKAFRLAEAALEAEDQHEVLAHAHIGSRRGRRLAQHAFGLRQVPGEGQRQAGSVSGMGVVGSPV